MEFDDDKPKPKPKVVVGDILDAVSIAELKERVLALEGEIVRVRTEIDRKTTSKSAADAFFKT